MRKTEPLALALGLAFMTASAQAQPPAPTAAKGGGTTAPTTPAGYLDGAGPDTYAILPPAPVAGSARYQADRTAFLATRKLKDTPRWTMAKADVSPDAIFKNLSCAIGVEVNDQATPRTRTLIRRAAMDLRPGFNRPKDIYQRQRPFMIDEGPICEPLDAPGAKPSADYPSGHTAWGWLVGLIMAELAPDKATDILVRARAYGDSRLVCGVHNESAVESGRLTASIILASLHGSTAFRTDLEAARRELSEARRQAKPARDLAACAADAALAAKPPY